MHQRKKSILTTFFLYLFASAPIIFIIVAFIDQDYRFIAADIIFLLVSLILLYLLLIKKKTKFVIYTFIILLCTICSILILAGGLHNTGILASLLIPIPLILLLGKRRGIYTLVGFFIFNLFGFFYFRDEAWFPTYNNNWAATIALIFVIITFMAYINEFVFDQLYRKLEQLTESFKISQERYKEMAISREKFLSLISHDLTEHIGKFASVSNTLNKSYEKLSEEDRLKYINQMATISDQNSKLLDDILKWSTVQNETIPYTPVPIKLERIYREVIDLFHPVIEEKKLSFFLKMKSNSQVFADYGMLSSILRNLVSNAVKFSGVEGEVRISAIEKTDFMLISVQDKGTGISKEDLQRLNTSLAFSSPGTDEEPGTGIGLILVKEFVHKNYGEFFIESTVGVGTEVSFTIPLIDS